MEISEVLKIMVDHGDDATKDTGNILIGNLIDGKEKVRFQLHGYTHGVTLDHWVINWEDGCDMPFFIWYTHPNKVEVEGKTITVAGELRWWDPETGQSGLIGIV